MSQNEFSENESASIEPVKEYNDQGSEFNPEVQEIETTGSSSNGISKTKLMDVTKAFLATFLVAGTVTLTWSCSLLEGNSSSESETSKQEETSQKERAIPSYFEKELNVSEFRLDSSFEIHISIENKLEADL